MKCGKPYCACVGTCFAQHSPLDDAGQLKGHPMTTQHTEQSEREEFEKWAQQPEVQLDVSRHKDFPRTYQNYTTAWAWAAWKAKDALLAADNEPPVSHALCDRICAAIKSADDKSTDEAGYMLDSNDCIRIVREQFSALLAEDKSELERMTRSRDWYKQRLDLLQQWQSKMRDPERTIVCDILANGQTIPDPHGERYGLAEDKNGPIMQRGTNGDGSPWMGTMRECLEDAREAARVEAAERRRLEALLSSDAKKDAALDACVGWINENAEHNQRCGVFDLDDEGKHCDCTCGLISAIAQAQEALK